MLTSAADATPTNAPVMSIYGNNVACAQESECTASEYAAKSWHLIEAVTLTDQYNVIVKTKDSGVFMYYKLQLSGNSDPRTITFSLSQYCEVAGYEGG